MSDSRICKLSLCLQGPPGKDGEVGPAGPPGPSVSVISLLHYFYFSSAITTNN